MEDNISQNDFLKAFGIEDDSNTNNADTGDQTNQTPASDASNTDSDTNNNADTDNSTDTNKNEGNDEGNSNDTDDGKQTKQQDPATSKSANAFAAMRVELAQKNKMLENVASVLGLDFKTKDSMDQLQTKLNEALAKKQGLPVETLERLNKLEAMEEQRNIEQVRNNAFLGFQNVKNTFKLTDDDLQNFANELVADGKNPFITEMDLMSEYKLRNFDKLIEKAKEQGIQSEIQRASKAQNNASTPGNTTGGNTDDSTDKVNSVKELNEWFSKQGS